MLGRAYGIARSLVMYHGVPGRHRKMVRFYGEFLGPGDIGIDVGAHVGSRVRAWRALGARPGTARLGISTATPTVSSLSTDWIDTVATDRSFAKVRWDRSVEVPVTTLDALIATHGEPAFCKIDVEGFEAEVLAGLTRPVRALSFEYLPMAHDAALTVLERVGELGSYRYNYSPIETMTWASDRWLDAAELRTLLDRYHPLGRSGDVYARLEPTKIA